MGLAALFAPFTPSVAGLYLQYLGLDDGAALLTDELLAAVDSPQTLLPPRHVLGPPPQAVFSRIETAQVEILRARFAGTQDGKHTVVPEKAIRRKHQKEKYQDPEGLLQVASVAA